MSGLREGVMRRLLLCTVLSLGLASAVPVVSADAVISSPPPEETDGGSGGSGSGGSGSSPSYDEEIVVTGYRSPEVPDSPDEPTIGGGDSSGGGGGGSGSFSLSNNSYEVTFAETKEVCDSMANGQKKLQRVLGIIQTADKLPGVDLSKEIEIAKGYDAMYTKVIGELCWGINNPSYTPSDTQLKKACEAVDYAKQQVQTIDSKYFSDEDRAKAEEGITKMETKLSCNEF